MAGATQTPEDVVRTAIAAGNFISAGTLFPPFLIKTIPLADNFTNVWTSQFGGDMAGPVSFYKYTGANGPFLPLGDVAYCAPTECPLVLPDGLLVFAPGPDDPACLAHPTGFEWILDDKGSGNPQDLTYYRMVPPDGYVAVGNCFSNGVPDVANYWCVKRDYLIAAVRASYWNDNIQRWDHNGDLSRPVLPPGPPTDGAFWIVPPILVSDEGGDQTWALSTGIAQLSVTPIPAPDPVYDPNVASKQKTDCGLASVVIVPYTGVPADAAYPQQALNSPFYFAACEPLWNCDSTWSTPQGGSESVTWTVGLTQEDSTTFSQETSFTADCNVGLQLAGATLGVSGSFTQSFSITTEASSTGSTEVSDNININFPNAQLTAVWSRQKKFQIFRSDGSILGSVFYSSRDQRLVSSPT